MPKIVSVIQEYLQILTCEHLLALIVWQLRPRNFQPVIHHNLCPLWQIWSQSTISHQSRVVVAFSSWPCWLWRGPSWSTLHLKNGKMTQHSLKTFWARARGAIHMFMSEYLLICRFSVAVPTLRDGNSEHFSHVTDQLKKLFLLSRKFLKTPP